MNSKNNISDTVIDPRDVISTDLRSKHWHREVGTLALFVGNLIPLALNWERGGLFRYTQ